MHKVSNTLLMFLGAISYTASFLLMGLQHTSSSYWAFIFPGLILAVVGADFEFCVANMYVMSSLAPDQQSVAGGIFQTVTKLCVTIGMGISTAVFDAVERRPASQTGYWAGDPIEPYAAAFLYCAGIAAVSVPLCAWLRIGTQGHGGVGKGEVVEEEGSERGSVVGGDGRGSGEGKKEREV